MRSKSNIIINDLSQAMVILNHAGDIIYSTHHIKSLLGYDNRELIGKSSFDLLFLNNLAKAKQQYQTIVNHTNLIINSVLRIKHKTGQVVWVELTATNLLHVEHIKGILVNAKNITENKKSEEQKIAQVITETQEKERQAIGAELHDNISQIIASSLMLTDLAIKQISQREILLNESSKNQREAISEIRKLSSSLVSYELQNFGLICSVKNLVQTILLGEGLRIVARMDQGVEPLLSAEQKLHLFRIIQEQINNILKHAKASKILVSLSKPCNRLELKIKDNGVGFDVKKCRSGIGISNTVQRVKALNGHFHITSEKGGGTSVIISFPLIPQCTHRPPDECN